VDCGDDDECGDRMVDNASETGWRKRWRNFVGWRRQASWWLCNVTLERIWRVVCFDTFSSMYV